MKTEKPFQSFRWVRSLTVTTMLGAAFLLCIGIAKSGPPGLSIQLASTNQALLTVTNAVAGNSYEIYSIQDLGGTWSLMLTGAVNETNFTVPTTPELYRFYKARTGNDDDGDGVPNFKDGNPNDPSVGVLTITIDFPANGSVYQ
jgi:hypothetical protein